MTRRAKEQRLKRLEQKRAAESPEEVERRIKWNLLLQQIDAPARPRTLSAPQILSWNSSHAVVGAAGKFELPVRIECDAAELSYSFDTKEMDIEFSIVLEQEGATGTRLPPTFVVFPTRCASHETTVRGCHSIKGPGTAKLVWDNEYSWINSKQLSYHVDLMQKAAAASATSPQALLESELHVRQRISASKNATYDNLQTNCAKRAAAIVALEQQIEELQRQVAHERDLAQLEAIEAEKVGREVDVLAAELAALSWRTLPAATFPHVLSFCPPDDLKRWFVADMLIFRSHLTKC
ncbi:Aste57867_9935 [Aphanomyces stellatus]|uniref:Aste57867_9935 protein n=1 Tax=Aphanomyces stellatus TaxID=120398 RepID=A0A485KPR4_9STRA|nr:hypothetical protein As57867_009896 [Aphanomyces stellatus]VFT86813.1 Aste57867_9935 [Aphanomyces stellatus]